MKKLMRSLFFNLFLVSIVIMNIIAVCKWVGARNDRNSSIPEENVAQIENTAQTGNKNQVEATETETEAVVETMPPTKEFVKREADYFDDAAFIGDSRVVGIKLYAGIDNAAFYCKEGLTVYNLFDEPLEGPDGSKESLETSLTNNQYKKVYLEIGINEIGIGTLDSFMEKYKASIEHIRELQPDAAIFVCGIMHVKKEKSESDPIFRNTNIEQRNERIAELADNINVFYVDINEPVVDEFGDLNPEYTYDEVHLLGKYYGLLSDCLLEHAVEWP